MDIAQQAQANFQARIAANPYPGRGLVIGRGSAGEWLQIYWIMGRSEQSRNRRFVSEGATLRTEAVDAAKLDDPSLIIYRAMAELDGLYVVSNGDQTDTIVDALAAGGDFAAALATREREPDAPNYTPRISGLLDCRAENPTIALSILRANDGDPQATDRVMIAPALPRPGLGYGINTYEGDGAPLPPFRGDPIWLPCAGDAESVLSSYWDALDRDNRVAIAVKRIEPGRPGVITLINRFDA